MFFGQGGKNPHLTRILAFTTEDMFRSQVDISIRIDYDGGLSAQFKGKRGEVSCCSGRDDTSYTTVSSIEYVVPYSRVSAKSYCRRYGVK